MLRLSLRRCLVAAPRSPAAGNASRLTAVVLRARGARDPTSNLPAIAVTVARTPQLSRLYSSSASQTAPAETAPAEAAPAGRNDGPDDVVTQFRDLPKLGVHENLVKAITRGMGYDAMTDVQTKTINAALQGKDLYVCPLSSDLSSLPTA